MPTTSQIVQVAITPATVYPSTKGFGTPAILALHSFWADRARVFNVSTIVKELATLGVPAHHPISRMAALVAGLSRKPKQIVVLKRLAPYTIVHTLLIGDATEGFEYRFKITDTAGVTTEIVYVVPAAATITTVGTAIAALIDPLTGITAVAAAGTITVTGTAGAFHFFSALPRADKLRVTETTANPGLAADLTTLSAALDGRKLEFFGVAADVLGESAAADLSAWANSLGIVCAIRTSDYGCVDPVITTDVMSDLKLLARRNTFVVHEQYGTANFCELSAMCDLMARPVGSATMAFKTFEGVAGSVYTASQEAAILAKNGSTYTSYEEGSPAILFEGKTSAGSFVDSFIGQKKLEADIQRETMSLFLSLPKVPITNSSLKAIGGRLGAALDQSVTGGFLAGAGDGETGPTYTVPDVNDLTESERQQRRASGFTFSAREAGAVHGVQYEGTLGV